jgi:hypothetical protein
MLGGWQLESSHLVDEPLALKSNRVQSIVFKCNQVQSSHLVDEPLALGKALRINLPARRPVCVHRGLQLHDCYDSAREHALCLGNRLLGLDAQSVPTGARGGRTDACKLMFAGQHLMREALRAALRAALCAREGARRFGKRASSKSEAIRSGSVLRQLCARTVSSARLSSLSSLASAALVTGK